MTTGRREDEEKGKGGEWTIAAVLAAMRKIPVNPTIEQVKIHAAELAWADRFEAAWKRDRETADLRTIHALEMAERKRRRNDETTNGDTVADIVAEMREWSPFFLQDTALLQKASDKESMRSFADRIEAAHFRELEAEQETAENAICKWSMAEEWLQRSKPFVAEWLAELREREKDWAGREDVPHARAIEADIAECEAILAEEKGGGRTTAGSGEVGVIGVVGVIGGDEAAG